MIEVYNKEIKGRTLIRLDSILARSRSRWHEDGKKHDMYEYRIELKDGLSKRILTSKTSYEELYKKLNHE